MSASSTPFRLFPLDSDRKRIQRPGRAAPWPEPVRKAPEVHLEDGVQHLHDGPLDDLSSSVAIPSGRSRPSAFGMYARREGLAG